MKNDPRKDEIDKLKQAAFLVRSDLSLGVEELAAAMGECRKAAHRLHEGNFTLAHDDAANALALIGKLEQRTAQARQRMTELVSYLQQHHVGDAPDIPTDP